MLPGLVEMILQGLLFVEIDSNLEHYFACSLNQVALLIHKVDNSKIVDHNYYIEIVPRLLSMKYGNKKNYHAQNVLNCFMIMVDLVNIGMLLII